MKYRKTKIMSLGLAVVGSMALAGGQSVFADNPYGIDYSGGGHLENYVQTDPDLSDLEKLIYASEDELQVRVSGDWKEGWRKVSSDNNTYRCVPIHYLRVTGTTNYSDTYIDEIKMNNSGSTPTYGRYIERIGIEGVTFDGIPALASGQGIAVVAESRSAGIATMAPVYTDSTCNTAISGIKTDFSDVRTARGKIYVKTRIQLFQNNNGAVGRVFSSDKLYFGLRDIDVAQSYKILNSDNLLSRENMFTLDPSKLQPEGAEEHQVFNMFNPDGNYIYNAYPPALNGDGGNIYVKITEAAQRDGLEVVFGFAADAGSQTMFYGKMYKVTYKSDSHGSITGINKEDMLSGENPSGTSEEAASHYEYDYWVADKDVTLEDGTEITKGTHMTSEQVKKVVVHEDLEFTVYHKTYTIEYKSDEHGKITGTTEENRNSSEHPGGSTQEPDEDYHFSHWICDKDVELVDGTKIEAGEAMTDEQVEQVKITQDLVFTAIHETKSNTPNTPDTPDTPDTPNTPNTGSLTKDGNNVAPIIGLMVAALASTGFVGYFIRNRKKSIVKLD